MSVRMNSRNAGTNTISAAISERDLHGQPEPAGGLPRRRDRRRERRL